MRKVAICKVVELLRYRARHASPVLLSHCVQTCEVLLLYRAGHATPATPPRSTVPQPLLVHPHTVSRRSADFERRKLKKAVLHSAKEDSGREWTGAAGGGGGGAGAGVRAGAGGGGTLELPGVSRGRTFLASSRRSLCPATKSFQNSRSSGLHWLSTCAAHPLQGPRLEAIATTATKGGHHSHTGVGHRKLTLAPAQHPPPTAPTQRLHQGRPGVGQHSVSQCAGSKKTD